MMSSFFKTLVQTKKYKFDQTMMHTIVLVFARLMQIIDISH